jgi:hypothetical protein
VQARLDREVLAALEAYAWPGNARAAGGDRRAVLLAGAGPSACATWRSPARSPSTSARGRAPPVAGAGRASATLATDDPALVGLDADQLAERAHHRRVEDWRRQPDPRRPRAGHRPHHATTSSACTASRARAPDPGARRH